MIKLLTFFSMNKSVYPNTNNIVKSQSHLYDGIALFRHALVNTTPDITKTILVDGKEVKMRDMEATFLSGTTSF